MNLDIRRLPRRNTARQYRMRNLAFNANVNQRIQLRMHRNQVNAEIHTPRFPIIANVTAAPVSDPEEKVFKMINDGEIRDGKTLVALLWYKSERAAND